MGIIRRGQKDPAKLVKGRGMKTIFEKLFFSMAALVCMFAGLVFIDVGLGRLAPERIADLYVHLIQVPVALRTILGVGLFFIVLGFMCMVIIYRIKSSPKMIEVEKEGRILSLSYATIKSFIEQIIGQHPCMTVTGVELELKEKNNIDIKIVAGFKDAPSVQEELNRVEEMLRNEIERVFGWKNYAFHFELREIGIDPQKKYFPDTKVQAQPVIDPKQAAGHQAAGDYTKEIEQEDLVDLEELEPKDLPDDKIEQEEPASAKIDPEKTEIKPKSRFGFGAIFSGKK